jgi:hypothetical protein
VPVPIVYLINLARSTGRLAATGGRLDELGLKWKRVDAFDGERLASCPPETLTNRRTGAYGASVDTRTKSAATSVTSPQCERS